MKTSHAPTRYTENSTRYVYIPAVAQNVPGSYCRFPTFLFALVLLFLSEDVYEWSTLELIIHIAGWQI